METLLKCTSIAMNGVWGVTTREISKLVWQQVQIKVQVPQGSAKGQPGDDVWRQEMALRGSRRMLSSTDNTIGEVVLVWKQCVINLIKAAQAS